jgi:ATP-dependent Lhr-like helicase
MPLSSRLCEEVRARIDEARAGRYESPEMEAVRPLLERQRSASAIPGANQLLIELTETRQGHHAFVFSFAGRLAHEALGSVLAHRLTRARPMSTTATPTDYGIELLTGEPLPADEASWRSLLSQDRLLEDLLASLNTTELARRQFRDVARVAGLIFQAHPGERRPARQVQASSSMFYEVFTQFDPANLLLEQARRDMVEGQLEFERLRATLRAIEPMEIVIVRTAQLTPFAFPLWAESMRSVQATSEAWQDRVRRMALKLEASDVTDVVERATRRGAGRVERAPARPAVRTRSVARPMRSRFGRGR